MDKFIGNKISKKLAKEIFGEEENVVQCELDGTKIVLIGYGVDELNKRWKMYSAKTNKYITDTVSKKIVKLKDAVGQLYVAD